MISLKRIIQRGGGYARRRDRSHYRREPKLTPEQARQRLAEGRETYAWASKMGWGCLLVFVGLFVLAIVVGLIGKGIKWLFN